MTATGQLSLESVYALRDAASRAISLQERFCRFHDAHPEVYEQLVELCRGWRAAGHTAWSIKGCFEVLRWQRHIAGDDAEMYRLNNSYSSRYARLLVHEHREFEGLFELRELKS